LLHEAIERAGITASYQIIRYRDDYRIFCNDKDQMEKISYILQQVLESLNFRMNSQKTKISENVVTDSIKSDKLAYIYNTPIFNKKGVDFDSFEKHLLYILMFARKHPNSGQVKTLLSDIDKIKRTIDEIDREAFDASVESLLFAKNIYIIGLGSSAILASSLNHSLRMIFDNVRLLEASSADEIYAQIMNVSEGDVIVAMSFPRYSRKLITAVNFAKDSGATVIALTDSPSSPIATFADSLLVARSDMASFADSLIAPLSVINALVVAVSRKKQDELRIRLHQLEKIWDEYNVYDTNR
jgi:D-arabinose 5-phosphate isomerase GutQ